jgi:DNA recombination protein RmuC
MAGWFILGFAAGAALGATLAILIARAQARSQQGQMRETFSALAAEALDANNRRLGEQSAAALEGKKALIDQSVVAVGERLEAVRQVLQRVEAERKQDFGQLSSSVASLSLTAGRLHEMLASTQRRGAWGERMAEDILRLVGMQEGVNYLRQSGGDAETGRPDFTFLLPNDLKANMDVKFPLERYKAYIDATDEADRATQLKGLADALRGHVQAVARRGYIDPKVPTVPYVLVFVPSEQIFSLVLQADGDLIDDALRQRVVLASPLTLYAMLSVIRQAAEAANVMKTADEVIALLAQFNSQWQKYNEAVDSLGARIDSVAKQYETVRTTRTNMLQRPLDRIEDLRTTRGLGPPGDA